MLFLKVYLLAGHRVTQTYSRQIPPKFEIIIHGQSIGEIIVGKS